MGFNLDSSSYLGDGRAPAGEDWAARSTRKRGISSTGEWNVLPASDLFSRSPERNDAMTGICVKPASLNGLKQRELSKPLNYDPWLGATEGLGYRGNYLTDSFCGRWGFKGVSSKLPKGKSPDKSLPTWVNNLMAFDRSDTQKCLKFKYRKIFFLNRTVALPVREFPCWTLAVETGGKLLVSCCFAPNRHINEEGPETMSTFLLSTSILGTTQVSNVVTNLDLTGERLSHSFSIEQGGQYLGVLEVDCSGRHKITFNFHES